jgi:UDP-N-acetylmuramate--alanine ligase
MHNIKLKSHYHFIGIGGIGMSALALILLKKGIKVSGSDLCNSYITDQLVHSGATVFIGHAEHHIQGTPVIVYSTAVTEENPEVKRARIQGLSFLHRSDLLAQLMEGSSSLLVTGTHGKTTTSSLLAHLLVSAGLDPSFAVGGMISSLKSNGGYGKGAYFVAEADESDGSFLKYTPFGAIITNVDNDHLDYWKTGEALLKGFKTFADCTLSSQHLFWCGDDEQLQKLNLPGVSYGFDEKNQLQIESYRQEGWKNVFDLSLEGKSYADIEIPLVGGHNVLNATAVFGLGLALNLSEETIRKAFSTFKGVARRAEQKGEIDGIRIYDDYAHHPAEIFATLHAIRQAIPKHRLVVAFQPHRFTRTRDCFVEFAPAFEPVDVLILTDIYSAGEVPIEGITTEHLLKKLQNTMIPEVHYIPRGELVSYLSTFLAQEDVLVTMGAGDITKVGPEVIGRRNDEKK